MSEPPKTINFFKKFVQTFNRCHSYHENEDPKDNAALLGTSYAEQHLSIRKLAEVYSDSFIDVDNPERSDGLSDAEAR